MESKFINMSKEQRNKIIKLALVCLLALLVVVPITACTGQASNDSKDTLNVCESSEPQSLDPGLNTTVDGSVLIQHMFSGLAKWDRDDQGQQKVVPNLATSLPDPVKNPDGTYTYTYNLVHGATWSDGKEVTAHDFVFGWNRSASVELASDFSYMFEIVKGYTAIWADDPEPGAKLDVTAVDDYTLKVVTTAHVPYWNELLAFSVFMPLREEIVDNEGNWATDPSTFICNGPYKMTKWNHNSLITIEKRKEYIFADTIKMPKINFYLSDNSNNQLANFYTHGWQYVKDVPTNEIATLKQQHPDEYHCDPQTGTYYLSWQVNFDVSPVNGPKLTPDQQAEVRGALTLLIDRNYITNNITQGGQKPASTYVPPGIDDTNGKSFYENAGKAGNPYYGYYSTNQDDVKSNYNQAVEILKKYYKFDSNGFITDFPPITYIYNTNEAHKAIAEYIQNVFSGLGIKMTLENQEWATFLTTKKGGDFSICRDSWVADFTDAICFLDLKTSTSSNNASKLGKGENATQAVYSIDLSDIPGYADKSVQNGTWAQTYDVLIKMIKQEENADIRSQLMHKAEDLLMSTNTVCPIYYYTHTYMLQSNVKGMFTNTLAMDFFMYSYYED